MHYQDLREFITEPIIMDDSITHKIDEMWDQLGID